MSYIVQRISFEDIKQNWLANLWPGRDDIKPMSSMVYDNITEYDMSIYEKYTPSFWGVFYNDALVAVNSGFRTEDYLYRSRGVWVDPEHRGKSISCMLFRSLEEQAIAEGCTHMWSYPRRGSHCAYLRYGFVQTSDWITDNLYGDNCYVLKNIVAIK